MAASMIIQLITPAIAAHKSLYRGSIQASEKSSSNRMIRKHGNAVAEARLTNYSHIQKCNCPLMKSTPPGAQIITVRKAYTDSPKPPRRATPFTNIKAGRIDSEARNFQIVIEHRSSPERTPPCHPWLCLLSYPPLKLTLALGSSVCASRRVQPSLTVQQIIN